MNKWFDSYPKYCLSRLETSTVSLYYKSSFSFLQTHSVPCGVVESQIFFPSFLFPVNVLKHNEISEDFKFLLDPSYNFCYCHFSKYILGHCLFALCSFLLLK